MISPSNSSINHEGGDNNESRKSSSIYENRYASADEGCPAVSRFRSALPQVLASTAQSLMLLSLGMMIAAPTVVIASLLNSKTDSYSLDSTQASWFAGILLICQPVGSILSGLSQEWWGRKRCLLVVNAPVLIGWYVIYNSQSASVLYMAACIMGLSIGFMEAPTLSYVGEISQPYLRGILASFTTTYVSFGNFLMYLLGTMTEWRTAILISCCVPVIAFSAILMIPESPIWLINKKKFKGAEQALCWLRGWVPPQHIRKEFQSVIKYCEESDIEMSSTNSNQRDFSTTDSTAEIIGHQSKITLFWNDIMHSEVLKPLRLVVTYFFFYHCASLSGIRPYMVVVFKSLNLPVEAHAMSVLIATLQISGGFGCMILVHFTGKRALSLISMICCTIFCICLAIYCYQLQYSYIIQPWIPFILFCGLSFCKNLGISPIPWTLLSEVFPSRHRDMGSGICGAMYYVEFFLVSKTFPDLQSLLQLHGVFFLYGTLGLIGVFFLYFSLPETEGKKLEDIEKLFVKKHPS